VKINKLKNNLTVISLNNPSSNLVSIQLWVNCGSVYENKKEKGLSHFIEHLLFKKTKDESNIASNIEALGGELNAFTSLENTCYYVNIPKSNLYSAINNLKKLVFEPVFEEHDIDNERQVIIEEINRSKDLPTRVLSDSFFKNHFKNHNYSYPILGFDKIIQTISKKEIIKYYNKYYNPKNCFLVVSGNFKNDKVYKKNLNSIFDFKAQNFFKKNIKQAQINKKLTISVNKMDIKENYVLSGFSIPNFLHKDIPALDVLATILGVGESSILYQSLRNSNLVNSIYVSTYTPRYGGFFSFSFAFNEDKDFNLKLKKIYNVINLNLNEILKGNLREEEIKKAINIILSEKVYELETVDGIGRRVAYLYALSKNINYDNKYYEKLKKVTYKDIVNVIKKYFKVNNLSTAFVISKKIKIDEKKIKQTLSSFNLIKAKKLFTFKVRNKDLLKTNTIINFKQKTKEPNMIYLDKGVKLILQENKTLPLFSLKIGTFGGTRFENNKNLGIYNLCSRSMLFGADNLSYKDIVNKLDSTASNINAFSGKNSFGFSLECINVFTKDNLNLLNKIILKPHFDNSLIKIEQNNIIEEIKSIEDHLSSYLGTILLETLYKVHPYRLSSLGNIETIKNLDQNLVKNFYNNIYNFNNLIISVVGDFNKNKIIDWTNNLISNLNIKNNNFRIIKEPEQDKARFYKKTKDASQSHIALAFKTCSIKSKDVLPLKLIYSILSGQSGRLFVNLREKKSLAYTVCPIMMHGIDQGYFGAYIASEHAKVEEAIKSIRNEFLNLKKNKIDDQELNRAKNYLLGNYVLSMQKYQDLAFNYTFDELYGMSFNYYKNFENLVNNITYKDILNISNKYFLDSKESLVLITKE